MSQQTKKISVFDYDETSILYLRLKDKKLAEAIDHIGEVAREVNPDLFSALVNSIVGQQISTKAHQTVWTRMLQEYDNEITPESLTTSTEERLQSCGITFKKAGYIKNIAAKTMSGELDISGLHDMSDEEVCTELVKLPGIGIWTAEMLMLFSMQRPNIFSFGDLAIQRGLRMLYHHRTITKQLFEKYRRRYSPYCSVASLYLWAIAGGAIPELKDFAAPKK